jgi:hypothetical protein
MAGSIFQGNRVTSNVYASTHPHIDVTTFVESTDNQVLRGLANPLPVVFRGLSNGTPVYVVATDVANGHESAPSTEISVTPRPIPALVEHIAAMNDTGVTGCTDFTTRELPCPIAALPNQDAENGRDGAAQSGSLTKVGFGEAGFDFTKLDANGATLPNDAPAWPCIKDNTTGLTWEVPGGSALASITNVYTWYQPDDHFNGGTAGFPNGGHCLGSACDTYAFVAALNAAGLCGFHDWRLPTRREMFSLVTFKHAQPAFDPTAFPTMPDYFNAFFWTSTIPSASALVGSSVWIVDIATGTIDYKGKLYVVGSLEFPQGSVMAVR